MTCKRHHYVTEGHGSQGRLFLLHEQLDMPRNTGRFSSNYSFTIATVEVMF